MRRQARIFLSLIISLFAVFDLFAQGGQQMTATGQITAEVIPVYTISETSHLNFGRFSPGWQGGELILTPQSTFSVSGTVYTAEGLRNAASFHITGTDDGTFSISLPSEPVILKHEGTARSMIVKDWMSVPAQGTGTGMLQNGFQVVNVGATLQVGTLLDNPAGRYTGSYIITFDFN
jgi:hypothetical protein